MTAPTQAPTRRRWGPTILVVVVVLFSLVTFIWNAIETSSARVNATTSANSVFTAGTVDLVQPFTAVELIFDATNMYPGAEVVGCVEVEYRGSVPASVRLHANRLGGTGLEQYIQMRAVLPPAATCEAVTEPGEVAIYDGSLEDLWRTHGSYRGGITLGEMNQDDRIVLHVTAELLDDNAAQGLTTDFSLTLEARP